MSITIDLSPDVEAGLASAAAEQGVDLNQYATRLVGTIANLARSNVSPDRSPITSAAELFELRIVSLEVAARLAGVPQSEFVAALGKMKISPFQYTAEDALHEAGLR